MSVDPRLEPAMTETSHVPILRYIRAALLLGVLALFAVVYMTQDSRQPTMTEYIDELRFAVVALGCAALGVALAIRRRIAGTSDHARATSLAIVAWAIADMPAIAGAVVFFITGDVGAYFAGLLALLLAPFVIPADVAGEHAIRAGEGAPRDDSS